MNSLETINIRTILILLSANFLVSSSAFAADTSSPYGLSAEKLIRSSENTPVLQIDLNYQDKTADLSSPHHSFNTELNNKPNNTSNEFHSSMGYRFSYLTPQASFNYSPDSYGSGKYYNYELGVSVPVKDVFSLETRYGWNKFESNREEGGRNNYQDWSIGVSTNYKGVKLKVDYIDVNAAENSQECGKTFTCEGKTVFSIIKKF